MKKLFILLCLLALSLAGACAEPEAATEEGAGTGADPCAGDDCDCVGEACDWSAQKADWGVVQNDLNFAAGTMVLYEVQVRSANACHPDLGSLQQREACEQKISPKIEYRAEGMSCWEIDELHEIKLGTIEDMLELTTDFREGITLRYIKEKVGANTVWLMPVFPHNDTWSLPDACDNLGSPYAVRDYMHIRGSLSRRCALEGRDDSSEDPCWGDEAMDELLAQARRRELRVMMDLAFNHFGHNYKLYDVVGFDPTREQLARGEWPVGTDPDFEATFDERHLYPEVLDTTAELHELTAEDPVARAALRALEERCPELDGHDLVRAFGIWRVALDWERERFTCSSMYLEAQAPGFYAGRHHGQPSSEPGDNFTNNWVDVKFLFHHGPYAGSEHEYYRNREYLFRVMNYWVSRGVDAFRLDHTTDHDSGLSPDDWKYIIDKVGFYARKRGQALPVFLAEEFHDQQGMSKVVDVMIDGYVRDMNARKGETKDTARVEGVLRNMARFRGKTYVMTALETHDEHRLTDGTGFDVWTGAGFWGIGATQWSTPMILMGQELGESWGLGFRKSDLLRSRFEGTAQHHEEADALLGFYGDMIRARLAHKNRALYASSGAFLRAREDVHVDPGLFAQVKWSRDGNVVFTFHNLWRQHVSRSYYIGPNLAAVLGIRDEHDYRLVDALTDKRVDQCSSGADMKWEIRVDLPADARLRWWRLERCD